MQPLSLYHRFKFYVERLLAAGPFFQLLVVWCIVGVISLIGGFLVFLVAREASFSEELWWSFLRLSDPGYLGDDEGLGRRFISTILTVLGYVLFMGTLVAIMTQWLFRKMNRLEQGLTPVTLKNHTVILGWTSRTVPVLHELLAGRFRKDSLRRIVVLADDITAGPTTQLAQEPLSTRQRNRVILRSGASLNPEHLHRVGVAHADTVIIPGRSQSAEHVLTADSEVIKILMSLETHYGQLKKRPKVIAELQDPGKVNIAVHTYKGPLQLVASDAVIARIMVRSALYPGLFGAINALLVAEDQGQITPVLASSFHGARWQSIYSRFSQATPCGVIRRKDGKKETLLAPDGDFVLDGSDEILLLADNQQGVSPRQGARTGKEKPSKPEGDILRMPKRPRKRSVLMLGWNNKVPAVMAEMRRDSRTEFSIMQVSTMNLLEREIHLREQLNIETDTLPNIQCIQKDYTVESNLRALNPTDFDVVMLFSSDRLGTGEEADARSIVGFMVLDYLLSEQEKSGVAGQRGGTRPQVLVELHDASNTSYVSRSANEVLVSPVVISHVLSQIARYPQLRSVYEQLLSSDGARLSLRSVAPSHYGTVAVAQLQQYALSQGCVLLGVQQQGRTQLNMPRSAQIKVDETLQLVVLQGASA
ncbi:CASTOR/POLLUX-related putative ion channel [Aliidiomarina indica]|uniref:CASTOR/POLLUX-related putative ion channel n=1 Tax=Aliidiomarina indica TaxID=2749147 RepID=UPI001890A037|nr:hypothetical protein [Aliidiomarina indica]